MFIYFPALYVNAVSLSYLPCYVTKIIIYRITLQQDMGVQDRTGGTFQGWAEERVLAVHPGQ